MTIEQIVRGGIGWSAVGRLVCGDGGRHLRQRESELLLRAVAT